MDNTLQAIVLGGLALLSLVAVILLLTGIARLVWGVKGMGGYVASPLFHLKMTLFVVAVLLSLKPTFTYRRWKKTLDATGQLPAPEEVKQTRKWVMWQGHVIPVIAVVAIFWARGM